jgi:flavodoxin
MPRACVIFDTRYGNTEKIAKSLASGLGRGGITTDCSDVSKVSLASLGENDLICVGGPTQYRTASKEMQDFLQSLSSLNLEGKLAFAFDTKRGFVLAGSAAKYIEHALRKRGMRIVDESQSAIIVSPEPEKDKKEFASKDEWKEWKHRSERLRDGEEKRFEEIGASLANELLNAMKK